MQNQQKQQSNRPVSYEEQAYQAATKGQMKALEETAYNGTMTGLRSQIPISSLVEGLQQALGGLQQRTSVSPESQLAELVGKRVDMPGKKIGILNSLLDAMTLQGFNSPSSPQQMVIGPKTAMDIISERRQQDQALLDSGIKILDTLMKTVDYEESGQIRDLEAKQKTASLAQTSPFGRDLLARTQAGKSMPLDATKLPKSRFETEYFSGKLTPEAELKKLEEEEEIKDKRSLINEQRKNLEISVKDTNAVAIALDAIEAAAIELGDFRRGFLSQAWETPDAAMKSFSKTKEYSKFQRVTNQALTLLARKSLQEKGVITNDDIKRVRDSLGSITSPLQDKLDALNEMRIKAGVDLDTSILSSDIDENEILIKNPRLKRILAISREFGEVSRELEKRSESKETKVKAGIFKDLI